MNPKTKSNFILSLALAGDRDGPFVFNDFRGSINGPYVRKEITVKNAALAMEYTPGTSVVECKECIICVHGRIYSSEEPERLILRNYERFPDSFAKDINGSYAIVVIDKVSAAVLVATDRMNSRKIFYEKGPRGEHYFFSSLYFRRQERTIDLVGLSSFIVNGYPFGGSTIFNECRMLDRATIYKLEDDRLSKTRYWDIAYKPAKRSFASFSSDLSDIILRTVKLRCSGKKKLFLSLSGGYDSGAILGALRSLKIDNVHCISYKYGTTMHPRSDEYIAGQRASQCGFSHEYIETYSGDLMEIYDLNARLGQLLSVCDDIRAWNRKSSDMTPYDECGLFIGDQFNYGNPGRVVTPEDYFADMELGRPDKIPSLEAIAAPGRYGEITESIDSLYREIKEKASLFGSRLEARLHLFIDIRISNLILNWRENFPGNFVEPLNPFIDNEYLDFFCSVPLRYHLSRKLFIHTIKKMFPQIFAFPSAITNSFLRYQEPAFRNHRDVLRPLFAREVAGIDEYFPVEKVLALFDAYTQAPSADVSFPPGLSFTNRTKRELLSSPFGRWLYNFRRFKTQPVDTLMILKRLLIAKLFCGRFDIRSR